MKSGRDATRFAVPIAVAAFGLSACGGSSSSSEPQAAGTPGSGVTTAPSVQTVDAGRVGKCQSVLPAGYQEDAGHSGKVTATTYSASADVQAALDYDQLTAGQRAIYLHRTGGKVDGVASCTTLTFSSAHNAQRFFLSYQALRKQAGKLAKRVTIGGRAPNKTVGYRELEQSFAGYRISSTTVIEAAAVTGTTLTIASTADRAASVTTSGRLLAASVASA